MTLRLGFVVALWVGAIWLLLAGHLAMLPAPRWRDPAKKWRAVALAPYVFVRMAYYRWRAER